MQLLIEMLERLLETLAIGFPLSKFPKGVGNANPVVHRFTKVTLPLMLGNSLLEMACQGILFTQSIACDGLALDVAL